MFLSKLKYFNANIVSVFTRRKSNNATSSSWNNNKHIVSNRTKQWKYFSNPVRVCFFSVSAYRNYIILIHCNIMLLFFYSAIYNPPVICSYFTVANIYLNAIKYGYIVGNTGKWIFSLFTLPLHWSVYYINFILDSSILYVQGGLWSEWTNNNKIVSISEHEP